jgi:hypothetical protein
LQISIANFVSCIFGVLTSIRFNNKHLIERHEINDPGPEGYLSAKFDMGELP